jgi:hypothetical protein
MNKLSKVLLAITIAVCVIAFYMVVTISSRANKKIFDAEKQAEESKFVRVINKQINENTIETTIVIDKQVYKVVTDRQENTSIFTADRDPVREK